MLLCAVEIVAEKDVSGMDEDEEPEGSEKRDEDGSVGGKGKGGGEGGEVDDDGWHIREADEHRRAGGGWRREKRRGAM